MTDSIPQKQCTKCHEWYPATREYFRVSKFTKSGLCGDCKECAKQYHKAYYRKMYSIAEEEVYPTENVPQKTCRTCGQSFPATRQYFVARRSAADGWTIDCKVCNNAANWRRYAAKKTAQPVMPPLPGYARCTKCHQDKAATTEYFYSLRNGRLRQPCRDCIALDGKQRCQALQPLNDHKTKKECSSCHEAKPATLDYFPRGRGADGLGSTCNLCRATYVRDYKSKNLEKVRATSRRHSVIYRKLHREQCRATIRRWRKANPEKEREYSKRGRLKHLERSRAYDHIYSISHREQINAKTRRRRAHKRNAQGSHTAQDIQRQFKAQRGKCYYCRKKVTKYHVDHVVPLSRGGSNDPSNLVIACSTCNNRKFNRLPHEWPEGGRLM